MVRGKLALHFRLAARKWQGPGMLPGAAGCSRQIEPP